MLRKIIYFYIFILLYNICALSIKNWEKLTLNFDFICMSFCTSPEIHFKAGGAPPEKRFHHRGSSLKHHSKVNLAFLQHCIKKHVTASSKNTLITIIKFIKRNTERKSPNLFFFLPNNYKRKLWPSLNFVVWQLQKYVKNKSKQKMAIFPNIPSM